MPLKKDIELQRLHADSALGSRKTNIFTSQSELFSPLHFYTNGKTRRALPAYPDQPKNKALSEL